MTLLGIDELRFIVQVKLLNIHNIIEDSLQAFYY